jgi:predicted dehydrogenase
MQSPIRIGVVGLGGFGQFVMAAFKETPEVQVTAIYDLDTNRTQQIADQYGVAACTSYSELAAHPAVDVVYIATPPALHGPAAIEALQNGKHLFVDKPLATSMDEAAEIERLAKEKGLKVAVNYVLRFNPVYRLAVELGRSGLLGALRHMTLENDASDEKLPAPHWFWKPELSGTILVEHGVHFFDIASQLAGTTGEYDWSSVTVRPGYDLVDRVLTTTHFGDVPATFYHAFDKPGRIERTEFRLAYDIGYITVKGWMPVELEVEAVLDEAGVAKLQEVAARQTLSLGAGRSTPIGAKVELLESYLGEARKASGRFTQREVSHRIRLSVDCPEGKQAIYTRTVQAGVADFARAIQAPGYQSEVTLDQAIASLKLAINATAGAVRR